MPTSVRLDEQTESLVRRLAKRRGATKSEVIREALSGLAKEAKASTRPYDAIRHLIGCVDSGGMKLSERTGEKFRNLLAGKKTHGRRAG